MSNQQDMVPREDYEAILDEYGKVVEERNRLSEQLIYMRKLRLMHNKEPE